jgi:hypothetical protein
MVTSPYRRCGVGRGRHRRLAVEAEFEDIGWLHQFRRAVARDQEPLGIGGMAQADMAEGVEDALIGKDAIGEGYVVARLGEAVGHRWLSVNGPAGPAPMSDISRRLGSSRVARRAGFRTTVFALPRQRGRDQA